MFIKFLDHDLRYGIGHAKKRLIVTFIMFFFLSIYHFWTLRIFELTDPQYLESPVTKAVHFLRPWHSYQKTPGFEYRRLRINSRQVRSSFAPVSK